MTIMAGMYLLYLKITLRSQEQSWIRGPMVNHSPPPRSDFIHLWFAGELRQKISYDYLVTIMVATIQDCSHISP